MPETAVARALRLTVGEDGLAEVVFDLPGRSVNTFDGAVLGELEGLLAELAGDPRVAVALFRSAKEKGFSAGADLAEIAAVEDPEDARRKIVRGQKVFQGLAQLPFPTLAAIHGTCLGAGLELALACSRRIAALDAELGLPEVKFGILPAWGGTQRLPRLIGARAAVELICTARRVSGETALGLGLVDCACPPKQLLAAARSFARDIARGGPGADRAGASCYASPLEVAAAWGSGGAYGPDELPLPGPVELQAGERSGPPAGAAPAVATASRFRPGAEHAGPGREPGRDLSAERRRYARGGGLRSRALGETPPGRKLLFLQARRRILRQTAGHYPAPLRALHAIEEGLEGSLEAGLALEARLASDLLVSPISKNLIHAFHVFEGVKRSPHARVPAGERPVARAAVVGAGTMGAGIAWLLAGGGLAVRLKDVDPARVGQGLGAVRRALEEQVRRARITRLELRRRMNRVSGTTTYAGFARAELVIEAVAEDPEVKKAVFGQAAARAPADALLCTNTSSLAVTEIASAVPRPERVAGLHFFNPVERMPLVEVVRALATSEETVATLYRLCLRLGKKPVVVKDSPGFLVNRLLLPYLSEALYLVAEGTPVAVVDGAMTGFGMPVGPLALLDDVGLDLAAEVGRVLAAAFPGRREPPPLLERLRALGRAGRKAGRGFYVYQAGSRNRPDPALGKELGLGHSAGSSHTSGPEAVQTATARLNPANGPPAAAEIERRLLYPMIDEAALCLEERVVGSSAELDLATLAGIGFPPFRGGLLRYADAVGVAGIVGGLERLAAEVGPRLAPSSALRELAARGGFYAAEER